MRTKLTCFHVNPVQNILKREAGFFVFIQADDLARERRTKFDNVCVFIYQSSEKLIREISTVLSANFHNRIKIAATSSIYKTILFEGIKPCLINDWHSLLECVPVDNNLRCIQTSHLLIDFAFLIFPVCVLFCWLHQIWYNATNFSI